MSLPDLGNLGFPVHDVIAFLCSPALAIGPRSRSYGGTKEEPYNERGEGKKIVNKETVQMTLSMCRGDGQVRAFLDAVPGYLQISDNVVTRIIFGLSLVLCYLGNSRACYGVCTLFLHSPLLSLVFLKWQSVYPWQYVPLVANCHAWELVHI
ncbi:hypothetical protein DFH94DRAFT_64999 [Russula ochroleuca]|jgi:hypothetical protein|uniref:Uncharacterized protein n=1 Tax=Russula ochroleuca TaxID=152965 RepID=A0A9P5T879_9AGAM|nr:hypothetical protein DFH94DRAFT_64999 [Russula ochroleuca]